MSQPPEGQPNGQPGAPPNSVIPGDTPWGDRGQDACSVLPYLNPWLAFAVLSCVTVLCYMQIHISWLMPLE